MLKTYAHELERGWDTFARRYNISAYEARLMSYDGGKMLCVEISTSLLSGLLDGEDQGEELLAACGLELLVPPVGGGVSIKLYLIPAS